MIRGWRLKINNVYTAPIMEFLISDLVDQKFGIHAGRVSKNNQCKIFKCQMISQYEAEAEFTFCFDLKIYVLYNIAFATI